MSKPWDGPLDGTLVRHRRARPRSFHAHCTWYARIHDGWNHRFSYRGHCRYVVRGAIAGYFGGRIDSIMMRLVDVAMSIPYMFVLILLLVVFGRSIILLFVGIGLVSWLDMARIVRGQTLSIKTREFVENAEVIGVRPTLVILRHIIPNLLGIVIVYATLLVPNIILYESFISFLGLGVQEPNTSLGALISSGSAQMQYGTLWQLGFPLFFFTITLFGFFFMGDGLRDALDPKDSL